MRRHAKASSAGSTTRRSTCFAVAVLAILTLALCASPAMAAQIHQLSFSFGTAGSGNGELSGNSYLAIDQTSGDVYVADTGNGRVQKFGEGGAFINAFGSGVLTSPAFIAVDNSSGPSKGDVYVADASTNEVFKYDSGGSLITSWGSSGKLDGSSATHGPFGELAGIAVDSSGTLYVYGISGQMFKFAQDGSFLKDFRTEFGAAHNTAARGIAPDSTGVFYKVRGDDESATELLPTDSGLSEKNYFEGPVAPGPVRNIAVDPSNDDLYVAYSDHIAVYDSSGALTEGSFGAGDISAASGVAVGSNARVYVSDSGSSAVEVFTAGIGADVATGAASAVALKTATLNGQVNPNGIAVTDCHFSYASDAEFQANGFTGAPEAPCVPDPGSGTGNVDVTADVSGLSPGTTYHYRLRATNANGTVDGSQASFETDPAVKGLSTGIASQITATTATLNGALDPNGITVTDCHFTLNGGPDLPCVPAPGSGSGNVQVSADVSGLSAATTYSFRLVATNANGTTEGQEASFETDGEPLIGHSFAANIGSDLADLRAEVNPHGAATTYQFEYGLTDSYGSSIPVPAESIGSSSTFIGVSQTVSGLQPNTLYHFRVVASNPNGDVIGPDRKFLTHAVPAAPGSCPNEEIRIEQESTYLPQCMAYELISPDDTLGNGIRSAFGGSDGDHALVEVNIPISSAQSTGNNLTFAAKRTSTGWRLRDIGVPGTSNWYVGQIYSEDGTRVISQVCDGTLLGCRQGQLSFERFDESGERTTMLSFPITPNITPPDTVAVSDDASRLFVQSRIVDIPPFLPEDTHSVGRGLYVSRDGVLEFLGFDANGNVLPCGEVLGNTTFEPGTGFEQSGASADGRTVAFESPDPDTGCPEPVDVYVRRDGKSVNISRPRNGNPDEGAIFAGASRDGEITYFTTSSQLVPADTDPERDIYAYDLSANTQRLISGGVGVEGRQVSISPAGDYVYFKSLNAYEGHGTNGRPNLYVYHAGDIRLVATASEKNFFLGGELKSEEATAITPDGIHILFRSNDSLGSGQQTGGFMQIFQYSVNDDTMSCVSCPPDGSVPTQQVELGGLARQNVNMRWQSDDGNSVAFETGMALLPNDLNGNVGDVYLWRRHASLSLISGGRSGIEARFSAISANGQNVFFTAGDRLVPGLGPSHIRAYVARVNGGFPPPARPTPCRGEACRTNGTLPAVDAANGTASFTGPPSPKPTHHKKKQRKKAHKKAHGRHAGHNSGGSK